MQDRAAAGGTIGHLPRWARRLFHFPPRVAYAVGLGPLIGRLVLLLTTTGRRTGKKQTTPLQYEAIDGGYYIAAARGPRTDWLRNIEVDPMVDMRVGSLRQQCHAEIILDVERSLDFLKIRLERHPHMISAIMRAAGLPRSPSVQQLKEYAAGRPLVRLEPLANPTGQGMI